MKFGASKSVNFNVPNAEGGVPSCQKVSSQAEHPSGQILAIKDERDACVEGLFGSFSPVANDFRRLDNLTEAELQRQKHFRNNPTWTSEKRERVKRFRFIVCFLGLAAVSLALMSRVLLNVVIVDMVYETAPTQGDAEQTTDAAAITEGSNIVIMTDYPSEVLTYNLETTTTTITTTEAQTDSESNPSEPDTKTGSTNRYHWSQEAQALLLASFHLGYIPSMLMGGGIADTYGAKYPLFICVVGSFVVSFLTPTAAAYSVYLLVSMRIILGLLHGGMVPALYNLFSKWLTLTETTIFVPLVKVALSGGVFVGSLLPGLLGPLGFDWPEMFYLSGFLCFIWLIVWLPIGTSTPQENNHVEPNELHRIMRKKKPPPVAVSTIPLDSTGSNTNAPNVSSKKEASTPIPLLLIITNPSVIALTITKYTYNLGLEFFTIMLSKYIRSIHSAPLATISAVGSGAALLQMCLITFVGWTAQVVVERKLFGLGKSGWRKFLQGIANFGMAICYILLILLGDSLVMSAILIIIIHFCWMFGAGGESMIPYDLSSKFPATIMGLAHGVSCLSGLTIPAVCGLVLGDHATERERWNTLFKMVAASLTLGGLAFCLVIRAKPFLPGEKVVKIRVKE